MKVFNVIKKVIGGVVIALFAPVIVGMMAASGQCKPEIDPTFFGGFQAALMCELVIFGVIAAVGGLVAFLIWCFGDNDYDEYGY